MTARKTATTTRRGSSRKTKTRKLTRPAISQAAGAINRAINRAAKRIVDNQPGREEFAGAENRPSGGRLASRPASALEGRLASIRRTWTIRRSISACHVTFSLAEEREGI